MKTLAVERHAGELWLCAVDALSSAPLARFTGADQVDEFRTLFRLAVLAAREAGASGL